MITFMLPIKMLIKHFEYHTYCMILIIHDCLLVLLTILMVSLPRRKREIITLIVIWSYLISDNRGLHSQNNDRNTLQKHL